MDFVTKNLKHADRKKLNDDLKLMMSDPKIHNVYLKNTTDVVLTKVKKERKLSSY